MDGGLLKAPAGGLVFWFNYSVYPVPHTRGDGLPLLHHDFKRRRETSSSRAIDLCSILARILFGLLTDGGKTGTGDRGNGVGCHSEACMCVRYL